MRILAALALTALLAACQGTAETRATTALATACDSYAAALDVLTPMRERGELSDKTIARVDAANATVAPVCSSDSLVDPAMAVGTVRLGIALITQAAGD